MQQFFFKLFLCHLKHIRFDITCESSARFTWKYQNYVSQKTCFVHCGSDLVIVALRVKQTNHSKSQQAYYGTSSRNLQIKRNGTRGNKCELHLYGTQEGTFSFLFFTEPKL